MSPISSEEDFKKKLKIKKWSELSKDKFLQYLQLAPDISKEIHIRIIEQIPNFAQLSIDITKQVVSLA